MLRSLFTTSVIALAAATAASAETVLDVTAWKGNEAEPAGMAEVIALFEAANPDIKVELTYISRSDTDVIIPPRLQGGNPPDVMMVDMPLTKVWGDAGLLVDWGTDAEWYGRVPEGLQSAITIDGAAYVMPLEVIGMGLFANSDLLAQAGITEAPKTIEALKAACGALSAAGINPMLMTSGYPSALFTIANGLEAATTPVEDLGNGNARFVDDAGFSAALDTFRELAAADCFDPQQMAGVDPWSTALSEFQAGNFAMLPQGAWNIGSFSQNPDLNFTFGPIPSASGAGVAADLFGFGWGISTGSEHQEAAKTFVAFWSQPENLQILLDAESAYSPFEDGGSGTPALAADYDAARAAGGIRNYPFSVGQWPGALDGEMQNAMTGFLLNLDQDNSDILVRWDETVEDNI
ncbi:raffinose/stachyose/melibiose transport system substrate-binding protein [Yoonia tamlensis]|uniref:Raffinose/stachyose/melibiose transport system substrate-binding protein n=1 Tax=Yoonia tamlensis TaxID=390270 RepID=A0A1I6HDN3_9RHOB|nr:extracellular solute-binding protein [Yoonia tamlensis]SFR52491.1 raffinose/stachyose/melibiose transport system substrate-binding protein [Yoonia tamlensis]